MFGRTIELGRGDEFAGFPVAGSMKFIAVSYTQDTAVPAGANAFDELEIISGSSVSDFR